MIGLRRHGLDEVGGYETAAKDRVAGKAILEEVLSQESALFRADDYERPVRPYAGQEGGKGAVHISIGESARLKRVIEESE